MTTTKTPPPRTRLHMPQPSRLIIQCLLMIAWGSFAGACSPNVSVEDNFRQGCILLLTGPVLALFIGLGLDSLYTTWYRSLPFSDDP